MRILASRNVLALGAAACGIGPRAGPDLRSRTTRFCLHVMRPDHLLRLRLCHPAPMQRLRLGPRRRNA